MGYCPWGRAELDTTEATEHARALKGTDSFLGERLRLGKSFTQVVQPTVWPGSLTLELAVLLLLSGFSRKQTWSQSSRSGNSLGCALGSTAVGGRTNGLDRGRNQAHSFCRPHGLLAKGSRIC